MLDKVFGLFTQVDRSLERFRGGLGIGLHLVKHLAEMHGGSVEARSEGRGSEFVVRLPTFVGPILAREAPPKALATSSPTPRRILVVDDNRDSVESLSLRLRRDGHETEMAYEGKEAVEKARGGGPTSSSWTSTSLR